MKFFLACGLLLISFICSAAIYMQSSGGDATSYSDMPTQGSQVVNVSGAPVMKMSPTAPTTSKAATPAKKAAKDTHQPYTSFSISSPVDQQTYQNQRDVEVSIDIKPKLQKGDAIGLVVDGAEFGTPSTSTQFSLHQLNRGTHQISAYLVGKDKNVLNQTGTVTFFIHYAALGG
jgi:hypothetical protein